MIDNLWHQHLLDILHRIGIVTIEDNKGEAYELVESTESKV